MAHSEQLLDDLVGAVLDGTAVDWTAAESAADSLARPLVRRLGLVASVARVYRDGLPDERADSTTHPRESTATLDRWGHLRVLGRVGAGAFGEVFRAWDTRLDREVALKLLTAQPARDGESSFIQEGRLLAKIRHPNVVTIYGAEQIGGRVGLWMEFVRGQTLEEQLQQGTGFRAADIIDIGVELCHAVSAVHAAGLLHRDIKAQNVTRAEDGRVVLMDFGAGSELADTSTSDVAGTPLYLAPEVLAGSAPTVQSDIYSLGVLLYHLATKSYPIRGRTIREVREAHERGERIGIRSVRSDLRPTLARVIERACDPRPEERYQSAGRLADDLMRLRGHPGRVRLAYGAGVAAAVVLLAWIAFLSIGTSDVNRRSRADSDAASTSARRSIAVLPFKPVGAGDADEGLRLGMTEAVIGQLGRVGTLRVEPLARVRAHGASGRTLEAGRALGVDTVAQAYVEQTASGVNVRLHLLRTADGAALVGSEWNKSFTTVLEAQNGLAQSLAEGLGLTPAERARVGRQDTTSLEAFRHYSFGLYHLEVFNRDRMYQAEREFGEAIRLDPRYARPHAALALTLLNTVWLSETRGIDVRDAARAWARKAIDLDESVALAHTVLGHIYNYFDYSPFEAQRAHMRAMELDDQDVSVLRAYSFFLLHHDAFDEAFDVNRRTLELYPASPLSTRLTAEMSYYARRYEDCVAECRKAMTLEPNDATLTISTVLGRCLEQQGMQREAVDAFENGRAARGDRTLAEQLRRMYAREGWLGYWRERLRIEPTNPSLGNAAIYTRLGNVDEAIRALERADATRSLGGFANVPDFDPLRSDPRFEALRARTGFSNDINAQLSAARAAARAAAK